MSDTASLADSGLLSPVRAGTAVEAAVGDEAWLQAMLDAEAALVRAQARLGSVPAAAATRISRLARAESMDLRQLALAARETANPVVGLVQALTEVVARQDEGAAQYVHRGSTSQDVFDTAAMLVARRALDLTLADLDRTAGALTALAARHRDTAMAGRTLALQAVPITFGLKAAGWRQLVLDAEDRLRAVRDHGLPVSLGGAAGTLAGYLEYARLDAPDAERTGFHSRLLAAFAKETGLSVPRLPWHALRTPIADLAAALAFTAGALGKLAVDVLTLSRTEIGEVAEPAAPGRGASSAMPHKHNPVLATLVRSAALQVPALCTGLVQCLAAEDERSAGGWHAEWLLLRECLRLTGGAASTAARLAEGLRVDGPRMARNLELTGSQVVSERLAARLAPVLGKAEAKRVLTVACETAAAQRQPLHVVLEKMPQARVLAEQGLLEELCDPAGYTGASGELVDRALRP
ncbi:3-carboxy-cis,cis-muconate cycloisomerase [Streptacidiphilus pinicola]|uniref:3-carboxy-cis,cis-muconate cycloisomerase n=1 Tax=Streptacidiphilus pinicola TaxID=2219663 RepID=A0A2X0J4Z1_9ACTN|nr:3-carboxy-cis,cis-muconate cycloisomerase [Streptacidiphilus pinicola]RAG85306.1 3-carboxy-cis,cis-muconate cycloisomerase [Streptacidiphilus pinicola]